MKATDVTRGPLLGTLIRLAWPMVLGNVLQLFVFGYYHMIEMKAAVQASQPG